MKPIEPTDKPQPGTLLLELGLLFLPAHPAYLWLWPNVTEEAETLCASLAYLYILAGTVWIGLRRWPPGDLGINRNGFGLSLGCGAVIIFGRTLVILAVSWDGGLRPFRLVSYFGEALFYIGLVGLVEELLFRGLVYHALEIRWGTRWAIWGSSFGFLLWHIFGQGPLIGLAALFYGLIFALIRWRAGGIGGLILAHGLMDLAAVQMLPSSDVLGLGRPEISSPDLLLALPFGLWLGLPGAKSISTMDGQR